MKYTVSKKFSFEAAHSLPGLPEGHKCRNLHGHSYVVEVHCCGELDARGFVIDYAELSSAVDPLIALLDHQNLNEIITATPTTAECLGMWLMVQLDLSGRLPVRLVNRIDVYETAKTCVRVER